MVYDSLHCDGLGPVDELLRQAHVNRPKGGVFKPEHREQDTQLDNVLPNITLLIQFITFYREKGDFASSCFVKEMYKRKCVCISQVNLLNRNSEL